MANSGSTNWNDLALKIGLGVVAAAVAGYACYVLSREDESESISGVLKEKVGETV